MFNRLSNLDNKFETETGSKWVRTKQLEQLFNQYNVQGKIGLLILVGEELLILFDLGVGEVISKHLSRNSDIKTKSAIM